MLIPIGHEDQNVTRLPWVTIALVAANVAVFLVTLPLVNRQAAETRMRVREIVQFAVEHPYLQLPPEIAPVVPARVPPPDLPAETVADDQTRLDRLMSDLKASAALSVFRRYGYIPAEPHLLCLFTSMFLHAGWLHLIGNMLFLWLAGGSLEDRWGRILFPILYVVSGIVATLIHAAMQPQSTLPLVGASGAIAGLMGAFLVRLATTRIRLAYWFYFIRGTFLAPAYVALPLWLLQQFMMARTSTAGGVAVWAHIGGFVFGVLVAIVIQAAELEAKVLAPAIAKKTTWAASEQLAAALSKLDRGEIDGAILDLETLLRAKPDGIEARTSLIDAYARKGDRAAAGRESASLVRAYLKARDLHGAVAAFRAHQQAHPEVPLAMRDQLALAADCEKHQQYHEAADRYREALASWPDDLLAPKALVGYGRLHLQVFQQPHEALDLLEQARAHPHATAEFQQASAELIMAARRALGPRSERLKGAPRVSPSAANSPVPSDLPPPEDAVQTDPATPAIPPPGGRLGPVPVRAVGIDARGLHLEDRRGRTGHVPWRQVRAISVAKIGEPDATADLATRLILDLVLHGGSRPGGNGARCVRLSPGDLAIPQLEGEPSPVRAFQRFVATILKTTGVAAHPSREACLGVHGFPSFPNAATYEADLVARLDATGQPQYRSGRPSV